MTNCFFKSYQRIIRQHLYIYTKNIPMKNTTTYFKYIPIKNTTSLYVYIIMSVFRFISLCFDKICNSSWYWVVKFFQDVQCYTIPCLTYSLTHLFFLHCIWSPISVFIIFQRFLMLLISGEFPGHSRMGIYLHSRNVLVLLKLWYVRRS